MKQKSIKLLSFLLTLVMCISAIPVYQLPAVAANDAFSDYAILPLRIINISQKAGGSYSHQGTNNVDFTTSQYLYAPFDCKVVYTDTSYARSDKGQIRCDVNVSLMKEDAKELGTRVEIKNINSFSGVKEAIICEVARQTEILNNGGIILQETRRYDEGLNQTFTMRSKEDAIDYRYFTDPNLPPIKIDREWIEEIKREIPKLHNERFRTYTKEYSINEKDAYTIVRDKNVSDFYEECISLLNEPVLISNWLTGDVMKYLNKESLTINDSKLTPKMLTNLIKMIKDGKINGKQAKEVLEKMMDTGKEPNVIASELGLSQISNEDEIRQIILTILDENQNLVDDYKNGKNVFGYIVGLIMKNTSGKANPVITSKVLKEELDKFL